MAGLQNARNPVPHCCRELDDFALVPLAPQTFVGCLPIGADLKLIECIGRVGYKPCDNRALC
eukprot:4145664-Heterocapsa_arctica.AAC.1